LAVRTTGRGAPQNLLQAVLSILRMHIPYAVYLGLPVKATAGENEGRDKKWFKCLGCKGKLSYVKPSIRKPRGVRVKAHFRHPKSGCDGGGPMTYVHKATQQALASYRGSVQLRCSRGDSCVGLSEKVTAGRLECPKVQPFYVDVVLTTSEGEVAVEVTKTSKTKDEKWTKLELEYGEERTVEMNVCDCEPDESGNFTLPTAGGDVRSVCGKPKLHKTGSQSGQAEPFELRLHTRADECERCEEQDLAKRAAKRQRDETLRQKGGKECKKCKHLALPPAFRKYWKRSTHSNEEDCCGWALCGKCERRPVDRDGDDDEGWCYKCQEQGAETTNKQCGYENCKKSAMNGNTAGCCFQHKSCRRCNNYECGIVFKPNQKAWYAKLCTRCYRAQK